MKPFYAQRRWGHGRTLQLARRTWCRMFGHRWTAPQEDLQRCERACGGMRSVR